MAFVLVPRACHVSRSAKAISCTGLGWMSSEPDVLGAVLVAPLLGTATGCDFVIDPLSSPIDRSGGPSGAEPPVWISPVSRRTRVSPIAPMAVSGKSTVGGPDSAALPFFSPFCLMEGACGSDVAPGRFGDRAGDTSRVAVPLWSRSPFNKDRKPASFCADSTGRETAPARVGPGGLMTG
jgi:hypothetical protein